MHPVEALPEIVPSTPPEIPPDVPCNPSATVEHACAAERLR